MIGKPNLWKCETCGGVFAFGRGLDLSELQSAVTECSCSAPNVQQPIETKPLNAIERVLLECERILAEFR
jgi:hypothetical protein